MNSINLKLLQTFLVAAEQGSFRKAADIGKRSASAISLQIRDLEAQVGLTLFVRGPHRVHLTSEGEILYKEVSEAMEGEQVGFDRLSAISAGRKGRVRIACPHTGVFQTV